MQDRRLLIVTDGLITADGSVEPHPELHHWRNRIDSASRRWYRSASATPLEWYARLGGTTPTSLASWLFSGEIIPEETQIWVASPFHARLTRDRVQVMPDALYPWHEEDSRWLSELLNPLLAEEGMRLAFSQECMVLLSRERIDAAPGSFATVSGHSLPNRHPDGRDGGRLMRLLAEMQMLLRQHPCQHRRERGDPDVDGVWLWGGGDIGHKQQPPKLPVAGQNGWLRQIADGRDAKVVIGEADHLSSLFRSGAPLPARLVLAGSDRAVLLTNRLLPRIGGKTSWQPVKEKDGALLLDDLRDYLAA